MKGALEKGDVAEYIGERRRRRIAFEPAAVLGQQDEREVRPWRLRYHPFGEVAHVEAAHRLFGDHRDVGAAVHFLNQLAQIEADVGAKSRLAQYPHGDDGVAPARREQQRAFGFETVHALVPMSGPPFPT